MKSKAKIGIFYAVTALYWASVYTYVPILSKYSADLGATDVMVGTILGSYGFTQMILRVPLGILSDKLGKRRMFLILGGALGAVSAIGMALAQTPFMFLMFRGLAGAAAAAWVSYTVLFSSYFDKESAPQAMSRLVVFNNLGQVAAMLLGGQLARRVSPTAAFVSAVACGAIAVGLGFFVTENPPKDAIPLKIKSLLRVGLDKQLLIVSFIAVLYQVINQGAAMGFTPKFAAELGASADQLSYITSLVVVGAMVSSFCSRFLTPRLGVKPCMLAGQLLTALSTIAIAVFSKDLVTLMILQFLVGIGNGLSYPMLMGMAIKDFPPEKRGAAMGFFQSIYGLGMFVGPVLTGFLSSRFNLSTSLALTGCIGFISLAITFFAVERGGKGGARAA